MDNTLCRREVARPRRLSAAAADSGASVSLQDGEPIEMHSPRESQTVLDRLSAAGGNMDRMNPAMMVVHKRHMPKEPNKFHIPRKAKEKRALFQYVSTESREFEDMMNILTSSYFDPGSAGCFTYSKPCLVHSELQEKEFVEKRREMKADGRTEKELEENYCFLLADAVRLPLLCENGLCVGQTWLTVLGNPHKGVYLSKYSDLLQVSLFAPGAVGEIIIFKVMKGKVKSIYENVKNLLDPTPRFDSHIFKNASKVTSLTSFRAFEFTQQYFYEYSFDELRQRPRQVCPYAVVSFQFKGKDTILPRLNSQPAEGNKVRAQFTVWTGDLVKGDRVLCQISLRSFSPPFLPHRLPEKLDIGRVMRLDQVTMLLPSGLFSYNRYNSSEEVEENGHYCRLLEVIDRGRTTSTMTKLLQEMEMMRVVLVTPLSEKGFLFLLSSVQMATPSERGENWKRCLQALFVFPETRDLAKSTSRCASSPHDASESQMSGTKVMPHLSLFIPALHHALVKARANPSPELSAGVERQTKEYLIGLKDGKVRQYPMGEYDSKQDEQEKVFPTPKHHQVNMNSYLRSYLANRALYLLSVARARQVVETHCGPEEPQQIKPKNSCGGLRESAGKEMTGITRDGETNSQKMQQLLDLVLTCKRNAENEVKREEGREGGLRAAGRKRRLEQKTAVRALKYLKASQGPAGHDKIPVEGSQPASPDSLTSVIASVGLRDSHLREDGSELSVKLLSLLTGLSRAARGSTSQEEEQKESCPFERLATKLGLPTNCDIDLRKQEELEEQTAGSVSSLEGFSPSSHSGEMNLHRAAGGRGGRGAGGYEDEEEWEIPWVLIPITGLCSKRLSPKDRLIPQDPRFRHLAATTHITTATKPSRKSPTQSPVPSPPASPFQCLSPEPSPPLSPSQCPSPDPSPPLSPSQCPSPDTSPPFSPSQCPSPEPSPCSSPSRCPSSMFPSHLTSPHRRLSLSPYQSQSLVSVELKPINKGNSGANDENFPPITSREFTGMSKDKQENPQEKEKNQQPYFFTSVQPSIPQAAEKSTSPSPLPFANRKQYAQKEIRKVKEEDAVLPKEQKDNQPVEKVQQHKEEGVSWYKQEEESVVNRTQEIAHEKEQKGKVNELISGSLVSQSLSSPPAHPLRDIDNIVDKHIGDFFTEMQHLLQEESIHCSFPEPPHSTLNTANLAPQHTFQPGLPAQFSHYVSLYNSCPPVQDYVSSLQDSINSMMTEFGDNCHHRNSHSSQSEADTVLASSVSAFVSSIRASNTKTSEVCAPCGDLTAADDTFSVCQTPALSRGGKVLQPDATHNRKSPALNIIVTVPTSASDSVYKPGDTTDLHSPSHKLPQSHWNSQQSHTLENKRTVLYNVRQDNSFTKTMDCMPDAEGGSSLAGSNTGGLGSSIVSKPLAEPSHSPQQESTSASGSGPAPPATALSSLINQLEPEVFNSLVKIIKDVKKNSLQFYLHSTEPRDHVFDNVKAYLVKQGNVEKSPVAFLNQENPDNRLLVIIKNKDIAGHIHKIPCLVSLKRRPSVLFVGIDTLDDIRNNSYNELFVSGGCVVSDELILNPDFITYDQLAELLKLLEQHSSLESVWKWKVHCKTHKKLKEQARFRRDSAKILDLLSAYQKKQIVEFLPYHHCDMMNHQSPDLECLTELQARYTQFRHTVFLTERFLKKSPEYLSGGIIVGGIEEILHNFTRMVGYHNVKDRQPVLDALLATKGLDRQLSHGDSASGSERSPSIFSEHVHPLSSSEQHQHVLQQPGSSFLPHPHLSDQLVPDASCKDVGSQPSDTDFEVLRLAISQLRAERQAQLQQQQQQLDSQLESTINSPNSNFPSNPVSSDHTPPIGQGGSSELTQVTPGRKAIAATLELIHSTLQPELVEEEWTQNRVELPTEGQRRGRNLERGQGEGESRDRVLTLLEENQDLISNDSSTSSYNENTATVTGPGDLTDKTNTEREKAAQQEKSAFLQSTKHSAATSSTSPGPAKGDRSGDVQSEQERPIRGEGTLPVNGSNKVNGSITMVTGQEDRPNPARPQLHQIQQSQYHLQQFTNQQHEFQPNLAHPQLPPHSQHQQWGHGYMRHHLLPHYPGQPFPVGPMLRPLTALGGGRGLLGPTPAWPGDLGPTGTSNMVWGLPQAVSGPALLGMYHNPAGQGSNMYRGGQRGGFNGM